MLLGKIWLLQMAKYWTNILAIWSHWFKPIFNNYMILISVLIKKLDHARPLFRLFSLFFKQALTFLQQINVKKSIPTSFYNSMSFLSLF